MKICVIGASERHKQLYKNLVNSQIDAQLYSTWEDVPEIIEADCIVLPIPSFRKGKLNLASKTKGVSPEDFVNRTRPSTVIISVGFNFPQRKTIDLSQRDDFSYLNAISTAEGAIKTAIESTDKALYDTNNAIIGFGRVGKVLADRLKGFGKVTVCARSDRDIYYAKAVGLEAVRLKKLKENIDRFDMIFQTVPSLIVDDKIIDNMHKNATIVELSTGGIGTDVKYANKKGINTILASALPEKTAPISAGNVLSECVFNIISDIFGSGDANE